MDDNKKYFILLAKDSSHNDSFYFGIYGHIYTTDILLESTDKPNNIGNKEIWLKYKNIFSKRRMVFERINNGIYNSDR